METIREGKYFSLIKTYEYNNQRYGILRLKNKRKHLFIRFDEEGKFTSSLSNEELTYGKQVLKEVTNTQKRNTKSLTTILSVGLAVSIFSGIYFQNKKLEKYSQTVAKITEEEINFITNNYSNVTKENDGTRENEYFTLEALESITVLKLDMNKIDSLDCLKNYPNLKSLTLLNAERLTDKDMAIISSSSIKEVLLGFDANELIKLDHKIDLNHIKDKTVNIVGLPLSEREAIIYLNKLENIPKDYLATYQDYIELDKVLDHVIDTLGITEDDSDFDKLAKISKYIVQKIGYDAIVEKSINSHYSSSNSLTTYYNRYPISSILNYGNYETSGICANYSTLLEALCLKVGLNVYKIAGECKNENGRHAWNIMETEDGYSYIDLTNTDNDNFAYLLDRYLNNPEDYIVCLVPSENTVNKLISVRELLEKCLFRNASEIESTYQPDKTPSEYYLIMPKDVTYYNENIEGKKVMPKNISNIATLKVVLVSFNVTTIVLLDSKILYCAIKEHQAKKLSMKRKTKNEKKPK